MAVVQQKQAPSSNAVTREIQVHDMRVRTIHENHMRIERNRRERSRNRNISPHPNSQWHDHETKRKRRVAKYRYYEAEGKVKQGLRTFKLTCMKLITNSH